MWYAQLAWAKELLTRGFGLERAEDILKPENRGCRRVPGTNWFIRTHGVGVDIFKAPNVGGIDFDFDKPHPDKWRLKWLFERLLNDGQIPYEEVKHLADDEAALDAAIDEVLK
jgi:hypothetical protein